MTAEGFAVHAPRGKTAILTGIGVVAVLVCALPLWLVFSGRSDWDDVGLMLPVGFVGTVFFGFATASGIRRLISPDPVLRVDEAGIHVWRYPTVTWEEFDGAEATRSSGETMLVLHTVDEVAFRARMSPVRRRWERMNAGLVSGSVYLSERLLPGPARALADRINAFALRPPDAQS